MNQADKIRRAAPGLDEGDVSALASLGPAELGVIIRAIRQARRDGREHERAQRKQQKADARKYHHYDESDFTRRNVAVIASQGQRAMRGSLDALAALGELRQHADQWIGWAVDGCRAEGIPDAEIGEALGYGARYARQEVHRRYGRRSNSYTGPG